MSIMSQAFSNKDKEKERHTDTCYASSPLRPSGITTNLLNLKRRYKRGVARIRSNVWQMVSLNLNSILSAKPDVKSILSDYSVWNMGNMYSKKSSLIDEHMLISSRQMYSYLMNFMHFSTGLDEASGCGT